MRLKRITPTNGLKQVQFGQLKPAWDQHAASAEMPNQRILTPDGWAPILKFDKIKRGPTVVIQHSGGKLTCDPHHRLQDGSGKWVYAGDLPKFGMGSGRSVNTQWSIGTVATDDYTVRPGPVEDLYDIEIPAPHAYFTSGLISHNSIMLCNNAICQSAAGNNVLLVTFELDAVKTALRCIGAATDVHLNEMVHSEGMDATMRALVTSRQNFIKEKLRKTKAGGAGGIFIVELPPDECSVNHIYTEIHNLKRRKGWVPRVLVLDYLELMVGRRDSDNKDDYTRQKQVANQVRGVARNEQVLVFTATQGNRSANDTTQNVDLNKVAESYGKSMSLDYVISLNQTPEEYVNQMLRLWIAKNRNGKKQVTIPCTINYSTMHLAEAQVF